MQKRFLIFLISLGFCAQTFADSPQLDKNHRYVGGKVTVLKLTTEQKLFLSNRSKGKSVPLSEMTRELYYSRLFKLTSEQTDLLQKETGLKTTLLEVRDTRKGDAGECTCFSTNLSLRFSDDQIEVIHFYLQSDEDAKKFWNEMVDSWTKSKESKNESRKLIPYPDPNPYE